MVTNAQISTAITDYENTPVDQRTAGQLGELIALTQEGLRQVRPAAPRTSPRWAVGVLRKLHFAR